MNKSKIYLYKAVSVLILLAISVTLKSQTITTSLSSGIRNMTDFNFGFNRRSDVGNWWSDNSFKQLLVKMNPDILRYPAGTQANYWDWRTGKFIPNAGKNWGSKEVLKIPKFISMIPVNTKAIYVMNLARPTPATGISVNASEQVLKSVTTLNAKIADMLDALSEFDSHGKLPYAVELGNEFFFGNEESGIFHIVESNGLYYSGWNVNTNAPYVSSTKQGANVENAKFYLSQCKVVVDSIKAHYPSMKIALVTTKKGSGNSTRDSWNNTIFNQLGSNPDFASLKTKVDAVTQHYYINTSYGSTTPINNNNTAKIAIAEGISYPIDKQADVDMVPNDYEIWMTEVGVSKNNANKTWASAVRYLAYNMSWIMRGDKVKQLDYQHVTSADVIKTGSPMKLAPIGIAAELLMQAASGMPQMQEINFSPNPIATNNVHALYGFKFQSADKETLLIINLNSVDYITVNIGNLISYNGQVKQRSYYSSAPYVSGVYLGHPNIDSLVGTLTNSFTAKAFSINVIEVKKIVGIASEETDLNTVQIFPNPSHDYIQIESEQRIHSVTIRNLNGDCLKELRSPGKQINISDLSPGVYLIEILTEEGLCIHKKMIKL